MPAEVRMRSATSRSPTTSQSATQARAAATHGSPPSDSRSESQTYGAAKDEWEQGRCTSFKTIEQLMAVSQDTDVSSVRS